MVGNRFNSKKEDVPVNGFCIAEWLVATALLDHSSQRLRRETSEDFTTLTRHRLRIIGWNLWQTFSGIDAGLYIGVSLFEWAAGENFGRFAESCIGVGIAVTASEFHGFSVHGCFSFHGCYRCDCFEWFSIAVVFYLWFSVQYFIFCWTSFQKFE